jgi:hypothetical protein
LPKLIVTTDLLDDGVIYAKFADIRDAQKAFAVLRKTQPGWQTTFCGNKEFIYHFNPEDLHLTTEFEGQVIVTVTVSFGADYEAFNIEFLKASVKDVLQNFGEIKAFDSIPTEIPGLMLRVEFFDASVVEKVVSGVDGYKFGGLYFTVAPYTPDITMPALTSRPPTIVSSNDDDLANSLSRMSLAGHGDFSTMPNANPTNQSPKTLFYAADEARHGRPGVVGQERVDHSPRYAPLVYYQRGSPMKMNRSTHDYASGHHNVVDVERIRQGLDVRTTV